MVNIFPKLRFPFFWIFGVLEHVHTEIFLKLFPEEFASALRCVLQPQSKELKTNVRAEFQPSHPHTAMTDFLRSKWNFQKPCLERHNHTISGWWEIRRGIIHSSKCAKGRVLQLPNTQIWAQSRQKATNWFSTPSPPMGGRSEYLRIWRPGYFFRNFLPAFQWISYFELRKDSIRPFFSNIKLQKRQQIGQVISRKPWKFSEAQKSLNFFDWKLQMVKNHNNWTHLSSVLLCNKNTSRSLFFIPQLKL